MTATQRRTFTAHTSKANLEAARKRDLGHIHQGKKALGWSDDDYRFHLVNLTGKSSSGQLDAVGRTKVLGHMEALGFKPKARAFKPFDQATKIKWLWGKIGEAGGLRDASPQALLAFVGRTTGTGVDDVSFLPTASASKVIEALKAMLDRAKRARGAAHD
ncbi:regulatory protein GemA [Diaphorobacter sp. HDW4A]|uniref:regulatory protein GemA n=1 Tax=Diaphorobacter sp. HDW4A TaxID=2714924 RepID=UPI00140889F6|nr:regulatory protein GemA [Diaphorobacter sp. HDW4A]QIL81846.1 regulatory protein GemA [Diaphorobacter sp. HDW4A]